MPIKWKIQPDPAGKGTVVDYLVNKKSFKHYSVGDYLKEKLIEKLSGYSKNIVTKKIESMSMIAEKIAQDLSYKELLYLSTMFIISTTEEAVKRSVEISLEDMIKRKGN